MAINDLTRQLPHFETRNEHSSEILRKNVKTYLFRIAYYDFKSNQSNRSEYKKKPGTYIVARVVSYWINKTLFRKK